MPKKQRKQHRKTQRPNSLTAAVKQLVTLNEAETNRMVPSVSDVPRMPLSKNRVFTASFQYTAPSITTGSSAENAGSLYFQLSNVVDNASWRSCFDAYRIVRVYVEFVPFGITASANATLGQFVSVIDYDDATPVTSDTLLQYDTAMMVQSGLYHERRLVPRTAKALYSGTFTSYGQDTTPWIDTDSPSVQHFGIKYVQSISSTANTVYRPLVTMVVNFRNNN